MGLLSVLSMAHKLTAERVRPGDAVVDATVGGGVDTLFLARAVGPSGAVYGFDIQEAALAAARAKLEGQPDAAQLPRIELLLASHDRMQEHVPAALHGKLAAVMFNLGYYPGDAGSRHIITEPSTTIRALDAAVRLLRPRGLLTVVAYPGHDGGAAEAAAVDAWAAALPTGIAQSAVYRMMQKPAAPYLIAIERQSSPQAGP